MGRVAAVLAVICLGSTLIFFQNCGKAGFDNAQEIEEASELTVDPAFKGLPFPYEISVNQMAHMACPINSKGNPNTVSPYFSWRVAAFDNPADIPTAAMNIRPAGMQTSEAFRGAWAKLAPSFSPNLQKDKLAQALKTLPDLVDVQPVLSFRKTNTPKISLMTMPSGGNAPSASFLTSLSDDKVVMKFGENLSGNFNTFPEVVETAGRFLDGRVIVPSGLGANDAALRANYDASYLAIGFGKADSDLLAGPADERYAYGKGFRVRFGVTNPHAGTNIYPTADSLAAVEEYDLSTGNRVSGVAWDCSYRFKIVMPSDRYKTAYKTNHFAYVGGQCPVALQTGDFCESPVDARFGLPPSAFSSGQCPSNRRLVQNTTRCPEQYYAICPHEPYTANLTDSRPILREDGVFHPNYPLRPAVLHALRRFLPADQWDVNVSRGCVVPKVEDNTCYQSPKVVYDETFFPEAFAAPEAGLYSGCGVSGQYPCAAYITMCIRK